MILVYTDDQGSGCGCYGSNDLRLHYRLLGETGIRFTNCMLQRLRITHGLLTGRIPARAGVLGNVSSSKGVAGMPSSEMTLAELFVHGYATGHIKVASRLSLETMPNGQGFDYSFGHRVDVLITSIFFTEFECDLVETGVKRDDNIWGFNGG